MAPARQARVVLTLVTRPGAEHSPVIAAVALTGEPASP
jgi:hypothetical protein